MCVLYITIKKLEHVLGEIHLLNIEGFLLYLSIKNIKLYYVWFLCVCTSAPNLFFCLVPLRHFFLTMASFCF